MKHKLIHEVEKQIIIITNKFNAITESYETTQKINVKDLEDMRRYSEILRNLSEYCESLYKW